ncbi:dihydrofolate reductase family protein, partial [Candidatus Daviesbacteria bacterium]|nr:dihydrofolate reductase family protein [Candidatus Daviesbacteria bacterium]
DLLSILYKKEIISVLVEGGGKTLGSFIDAKVVDKVYAFHAPIIIGGEKAVSISGKGSPTIPQALHLKNITYKKFGDNILTIGYT